MKNLIVETVVVALCILMSFTIHSMMGTGTSSIFGGLLIMALTMVGAFFSLMAIESSLAVVDETEGHHLGQY